MSYRSTVIRLILILSVFGLVNACASGSRLRPLSPEVSFAGISIKKASLFLQTFEVSLNVDNPNSFDVPLEYLDYELFFNGVKIGSGSQKDNYDLKAKSVTQVPLELQTNIISLMSKLGKANQKATGNKYQIKGQAKLKNWSARSFKKEGEVDLDSIMSKLVPMK